MYGNVCAVKVIEDIASRHNLKVIYDAAHAFGVKYRGQGIAGFGDASCFSFHATKVFHTIEGGAVACQDGALDRRIAKLKNFGLDGQEDASEVGGNSKLEDRKSGV